MLAQPLQIGPVRLANNLLLAPIAGYCDLAFRTVCREWGGVGLACTDLLSPQGLLRGTATSLDLAATNAFDKPVGMQLYGSDPEIMAQGARWAVEHGATVVDINMGCPVDKVTKKDGGSALLTDLSRAVGIAARVVKELERCPLSAEEWRRRQSNEPEAPARTNQTSESKPPTSHAQTKTEPNAQARAFPWSSSCDGHASASLSPLLAGASGSLVVPLTCKIRLCWSNSDYDAGLACSPHLARMLADVGVVAVTVHGRTTEMKFSGECKREGIARVVESVNGAIPIIGNGDVKTPMDAERMLRETGCQGVMIGRAALSEPWLFRAVDTYLRTGEMPTPPTLEEKLATVRRYFDLMRQHRDERYAMWQIVRRISWFAKKMAAKLPDGRMESVRPFKEAVRTAKTPAGVYEALERFGKGELRGGAEKEVEEAEV